MNLALPIQMNIIRLTRGMSLIGIGLIWLLSLVCLLMRIIASFLCYTGYLNFIKDPISHVLLLILAHELLLSCLYNFDFVPYCDLKPCCKIL